MDKKVQNIFNAPSQTDDEIIERQAAQQSEADELKISMLPLEQQEMARTMMRQRLMGEKPQDPLAQEVMRLRGQRKPTPEEEAQMGSNAMANYNSPQAQAIRARFNGEAPAPEMDLAKIAGLLNSKPRLRQPVQEEEIVANTDKFQKIKNFISNK